METVTRTSPAGVVTSVLASLLFGIIFFISGAIDARAETIVAWRVLITAACYLILLMVPAGRQLCGDFWRAATATRWRPLAFVALVLLIALQLWLFAWAPKGHALDASLGYLLLPIFLVAVGRFFFKDDISHLQWWAVGIAVVAVGIKFLISAQLSWVTLAIAAGYALYFGIRKATGLNNAFAYGAEVIVLSPLAILLLVSVSDPADGTSMTLVMIAGFAGCLAMVLYLAASTLLTMPVFGLLSYGEPLLLFIAALLLGETLGISDGVVYGLLGISLMILALDGLRRSRVSPAPVVLHKENV
ncbi:EamA-like transporter family protein [Corynebacterium faecale]|uniref:EamA family transporter n=1 Tax=Corynebacterium faecale TaxID=1758466 RepID=UPI003F496399|nr:EamA-like transporter family protein [Corynebacterium faecale]